MKCKMKLMPLLVSVTLMSGCTVFPGSNMSTMGKDVIKQQDADFDLDRMVNVYPLTPRLVEQLRPRPNVAQPNMSLDQEIASYQYRVGPGDVLRIIDEGDWPTSNIQTNSFSTSTSLFFSQWLTITPISRF